MTETSAVDLGELRKPFPPEYVGKLPRVTCPNCSRGSCGEHNKAKCGECGNYISTRHIHLDYVGHADVTIRLLDVDLEWSWAPKATDPDPELLKAALATGDLEIVRAVIANAPPKFETDRNGSPVGLWINLTVGGVTRLGYGSCPSNQNDAEKVLIGDALRNAAMRFGIAVELWAKGDRADPTAENATASAGQAKRGGGRQSAGDVFENATPAPPRQPANGNRNGAQRKAADKPATDEAAQAFADEAARATTPQAIEGIHERARKAGKVTASIRNPASGGIGQLALYLDWRKKQLKDANPGLSPDDPWRVAFRDAADAVEAERLLADLRDQAGRGEVDPGRATLIEQVAEELFPGITAVPTSGGKSAA